MKTFDQQLIDLEPTERDDRDDAEVKHYLPKQTTGRPHQCPPDKFPCALCYPGHDHV